MTLAPAPPLKEGAEKRFFMKVSKGKRVDCLQSAFSRRFVELVVTRTVSQSVRVGTKDAVYKNSLHYIRFSNYNGSFPAWPLAETGAEAHVTVDTRHVC